MLAHSASFHVLGLRQKLIIGAGCVSALRLVQLSNGFFALRPIKFSKSLNINDYFRLYVIFAFGV